MLRCYTREQVVNKTGIDDAELRFLLLHLRELFSTSDGAHQKMSFSDAEVALLTRAFRLIFDEGHDPAEVRASLIAEHSQNVLSRKSQAVMLAFCGARPGAGKSVVVSRIAAGLAARGCTCVIFDASFTPAAVPSRPPHEAGWSGISRLDSGVWLICGEKLLNSKVTLSDAALLDLEHQLSEIDTTSDFVLVDTGAGRSDNALRFAMVVDETVIVTTPDVESNTECFSAIRMLLDVDSDLRVSIIINRAASLNQARESFARINGAAGRLGMGDINALGWVAEDEALRASRTQGGGEMAHLPTSISARCVARITDHLVHRLAPARRRSGGGLVALLQALQNSVMREALPVEKI